MASPSVETVRLFDEGKTPDEIASILDVPVVHVHALLASRRRLLDNPHVGIARDIFRALAGDAEQGAPCHHHWHPTSSRPRSAHICCHCGATRSMIGMPPEYYDRADDCGPCLPGHTP